MPNSETSMASAFERMVVALNSDPEFVEKAAFFKGSVELQILNEKIVFIFDQGTISSINNADGTFKADLVFSAPDSEWKKLATGEIHLIKSLNPYHGNMSLAGNPVILSGNMRPIYHLFGSLKGHVNV